MAKGDGKEFAGLIKVKKNLLNYANELAKKGQKKAAQKIRFAVGEMSNPLIMDCAKIIMKDGLSASEAFAMGMLTMLASSHE